MDRANIERKAIETLDLIQPDAETDVVDVIKIAKKLGFVVGNAGMPNEVDGFIIIEKGNDSIFGQNTDKIIGVNASKDLAWKRFIIAHEIGHYILHYDESVNNGMYARREHKKGKDSVENEADYFAANLLMPRERFINRVSELKEKKLTKDEMILLLANRFCVTLPMTRRRFEELKINL